MTKNQSTNQPTKKSRGERNNNPGNIRKSKDKWQGLASSQPDSEFFTFKDPTYGIRAMARIIIKYQDDYNATNIKAIISRWAPPKGDRNGKAAGGEYTQNTTGYIKAVASEAGVSPTEKVDVHKFSVLYPIMKAMMRHEMGYEPPYTEAQITKGLVLAGVEPAKKPVTQSSQVKVAAAGGGLTLASMGADVIEKSAPAFPLLEKVADVAPYVLGVLVLACIGYVIYDRWDKHQKGII